MKRRTIPSAGLLGLLFLGVIGCADFETRIGPFPRAPRTIPAKAALYIHSDLGLYYDRDNDTCVLPIDHREALDKLGYPLARMNVFQKTEVVETPDAGNADFLVSLSVPNHRITYKGHNQWYPVAIGLWFLVLAPAWWVPDEVFEAELDVEIAVTDCLTGKEIYRKALHASATRHLNDLERGWTPVAVFNDNFDEENFRLAVRRLDMDLWKIVHEDLFEALTEELPAALEENRWRPRYTDRAIVVGIGDDDVFQDAEAVAAFLKDKAGFEEEERLLVIKVRPGEPVLLEEGELPVDPFEKVFAAIREWKNIPFPERNRIVFYFAGKGALLDDGSPALVSSAGEGGKTPLAKVLEPLEELMASTVILDVGFDPAGGPRSFAGGRIPDLKTFEAAFTAVRPGLVLVARPGEACLLDPVTGRGALTRVLLRAMEGGADLDEDGEVTGEEALQYFDSQLRGFAAAIGAEAEPFLRFPEEAWVPLQRE